MQHNSFLDDTVAQINLNIDMIATKLVSVSDRY